MPYIKKNDRSRYTDLLDELLFTLEGIDFPPGHINFIFSRIVNEWFDTKPLYQTIAEITGVLENVKQEFYRRKAIPYEDKKIEENGDI